MSECGPDLGPAITVDGVEDGRFEGWPEPTKFGPCNFCGQPLVRLQDGWGVVGDATAKNCASSPDGWHQADRIQDDLPPSNAWVQIHSGEPFYPLSPKPEDINIDDIAHALGMVCRYGGHCTRFYSVAEHSWLMSHTVAPEHALWALLHDAAEAYVGDMVRPLKHVMPEFMAAEDRIMEAITTKFNLPGQMPDQVKEHDTRIVVDEREQIMAPSRLPWTALDGYAPLGVTIDGWPPVTATHMFKARFDQLTETKET